MMMEKKISIALLIPAYNAARTLPELIRATALYVDPADTYVVDDGSDDETNSVLKMTNVHVIRHGKNLGKGAALRTGIEAIRSRARYDALITMDADLQHDPFDLPRFVGALTATTADIVLGNRERNEAMPIPRKLSNFLTSAIVRLKTGSEVPDSQCGFRAIRLKLFETVHFYRTGYEAETELLIRALKQGYTAYSVPIRTIYNKEKSHMTHFATAIRFVRVILET